MNSVRSCLFGLVLVLTACSGDGRVLADDFPSEFEFFVEVVACTEDRTGLELGPLTASPDGELTVEARQVAAAAEREAESDYRACVEQSLPVAEPLEPMNLLVASGLGGVRSATG